MILQASIFQTKKFNIFPTFAATWWTKYKYFFFFKMNKPFDVLKSKMSYEGGEKDSSDVKNR